jgi:cytochrome c-type biogenesis protein
MIDLGSHAYLAFAAGVLSVLSPCVLPLMPAYLSLISGITVEEMQEASSEAPLRRRVMSACVGFIAGFSLVFVMLGVGAVSLGRLVKTWQLDLLGLRFGFAEIMGLVVILLGLHMTGVTPIRALYRDTRFHVHVGRHGFASSFLVGGAFALGWSPCIGPILASILGLAAARESALQGAALLGIYSAGLAIPFLLAGWSLNAFFETFQRVKRHFRALEVASGTVLVGVGFLLLTDQLSWLNSRLGFLNAWIAAVEQALQ